jgi:hypothetical protein
MNGHPVIHHDENITHKRFRKLFRTNRGTHWSIAGSVAVIILGSYLIYSIRESNPTTVMTSAAAEQSPIPRAPAPLTLEK